MKHEMKWKSKMFVFLHLKVHIQIEVMYVYGGYRDSIEYTHKDDKFTFIYVQTYIRMWTYPLLYTTYNVMYVCTVHIYSDFYNIGT